MAWVASFNGTNEYLSLPVLQSAVSGVNVSWDLGFSGYNDGEDLYCLADSDGTTGDDFIIARFSTGDIDYRRDSVNYNFSSAIPDVSGLYSFRFEMRYSGADRELSLYVNDVFVETKVVTNASVADFSRVGRINTLYNKGFFSALDYVDNLDSSNNINLDATASDHTSGSNPTTDPFIVIDLSGNGKDATGVNMTTSNWIDLGESGNTSTISFDVPAPQFSASGSFTAPTYKSDVDFTVPAPEFSIDASFSAPCNSSDVSFDVVTPEFSVSAEFTRPEYKSDIDVDIPAPEFSVSASFTQHGSGANVNFDVPAPEFSVDASFVAPTYTSDIDVDIPVPQFSISASFNATGNDADIDFIVPSPEFSVSASFEKPVNTANISFTIPAPEWVATITDIVVSDDAVVKYVVSSNIVTYNVPTNIVKLR